jgi:hypothetical protein
MASLGRASLRLVTLIAGFCATHILVAAASEPAQTSKPPASPRTSTQPSATVTGRVTDKRGKSLSEVRVIAAIPATDMRFVGPGTKHKVIVAKTDAGGEYWFEIPGITRATKISLDAMKPGYGRWVGTLMSGGRTRDVEVAPGANVRADLTVTPALYVAGTVVDDRGKPLSGVQIASDLLTMTTRGALDRTASNPDGSFELFDFPLERPKCHDQLPPGIIFFAHPGYDEFQTRDIYSLEPGLRTNLRIVLRGGHTVTGTILSTDGAPVSHLTVTLSSKDPAYRRATVTNMIGEFRFQGLAGGPLILTARDATLKQKIMLPLSVEAEKCDLRLRLERIIIPRDAKTYLVLGMLVVNLTPELRAEYVLSAQQGVLVLDPGKRGDSRGVPEGCVLRTVQKTRVKSVRAFADTLIASLKEEDGTQLVDVECDAAPREPTSSVRHLAVYQGDLTKLVETRDECRADEQRAILALGKLGAHFRLKPAPDNDRLGREVSLISLGNDWKGADADLRLLFAVPFEIFVVHGPGKVSDKALEQLRKARPDSFVGRSSEAYLGADFNTDKTDHLEVSSVAPKSPAARAGFREGDVLLKFAGQPTPHGGAFSSAISSLRPGQEVPATLLRDGKTLTVTVKMGEWD